MYQMTLNIPFFQFQGPLKCNEIGIFGMKIYHLANPSLPRKPIENGVVERFYNIGCKIVHRRRGKQATIFLVSTNRARGG
jgi:hypothetical protein